jgi:hypothetical protein
MNAIRELLQLLAGAWHEADLGRRLAAWWWVVTHRQELDTPGGWLQ